MAWARESVTEVKHSKELEDITTRGVFEETCHPRRRRMVMSTMF